MVAADLVERWQLGKARERFKGRIVEGRLPPLAELGSPAAPGLPAPRVAVLCPQTYMNDSGKSVGPARGALKVPLERLLVVYDEIDLPFGEIRFRLGGGLAGHNGLKSLRRELGSADFARLRVGVGRPDSTDPEIVSAWVLGRFGEPAEQVAGLIGEAADAVERVVLGRQEGVPGQEDIPGQRAADAGAEKGRD